MNQQEWIELFKSVNGRKPTADELVAAAKAGVIPSPSREKSVRPEVNNQAEADKERPVFSRPAPERDKFGRKLTPPQPSDLERPKPNAVASESPSEQASQKRRSPSGQEFSLLWWPSSFWLSQEQAAMPFGVIMMEI